MNLLRWLVKPIQERKEAQEDYDRAIAEMEMITRMFETGEPQTMPERFVEAQKAEGRAISVEPGPNFPRLRNGEGGE